ncbi:MAG: hypothetical protein Kow00127_14010 [Bacteroidales bacterium]
MKKESADKIRGWTVTLLLHSLVVVLLLILGFTTPLPLPEEEGVEVNVGTSETGSGSGQVRERAQPQSPAPPLAAQEIPDETREEIITQETESEPVPVAETKPEQKTVSEELPRTAEPQEVSENSETEPEKTEEPKPVVNPAALYKGKQKGKDQGEGITRGEGDQGKPGGNPQSSSYSGNSFSGAGNNWFLKGRKPAFLPKPANDFSENGTVVVQITVNRYGKVVKAVAIDKGSTTTNRHLRKLAEEAAMKAVFNADMKAAEFQRGTITYHFIVKN